MKHRIERVQEVVKRELSDLIHRHVHISGALVTVNQVDLTADLKQAHVYIGVIGSEPDRKDALQALGAQRRLLQHELGRRVVLKYTPQLHFKLDESVERATRIFSILDEIEHPPADAAQP